MDDKITTLQSGANFDPRKQDDRNKDYLFNEVVYAPAPVIWEEKKEWRHFSIFNQDGSGSCVAQTMAKLLGVMYFIENGYYVHFSATHIYQRRANKPEGGMSGVDAFEIARQGVTLEELVKSQNMNDQQMDGEKIAEYKNKVGEIFKIGGYVQVKIGDIETVASIIQQTGKAVMVWFYFNIDEWKKGVPTINGTVDKNGSATIRHSVTAVDFTLYEGKKALVVEDSWGVDSGINGQRIITEEFYNERNFFAGYAMNFDFDRITNTEKPSYNFLYDLQFGMTNNDIVKLQDILKYEGVFPVNIQSTGYFGAITKKAVQKLQDKYNIAKETDPGYGRVGPRTRNLLNFRY